MTPNQRMTMDRLRAVVTERLGLLIDDDRIADIDAILRDRVARCAGGSLERYVGLLEQRTDQGELHALAERITVGETYFFRNPAQLAAFAEVMLPDRMPGARARGELTVLSAGCATGEEAYTLAMIARDHVAATSRCAVKITGVDVNGTAIEKARRGCYTEWSLRQVPQPVREREFRRVDRDYCVEESVRALVQFEVRNLVEAESELWRPGRYDVVFFRNVAMYLTSAVFREVIARCAVSLTPGGYLVLGDAESLRGVSADFELRHTHGAFYYQLRGSVSRGPAAVSFPAESERMPAPIDDRTWFEAIRLAAERIARLSTRPRDKGAAKQVWDLGVVLELLRQERLDAAHQALDALPPEAERDVDALLLRAVVLTNRGLVDDAEAACVRLLDIDALNAGAHYLRALCREHRGDRAAAAEHDRTALHLDNTFAMPRLHLGLLAHHAGDHETARREFTRALDLLPREDAARILLFGGGFTREALLSLCRTELQRGRGP